MASHDNRRPGPGVERAVSFDAMFCGDPGCGLHIVAKREFGTPICEIVMSPTQTLAIVEACKNALYDKATRRDGDAEL